MIDETNSETSIRENYTIGHGFNLKKARIQLRSNKNWQHNIIQCSYRPFDTRWCYFGYEFMDRPRREIMDHVAFRENLCLNLVRQTKMSQWQHALISSEPTPAVFVEIKDGSSLFPLYLYPSKKEKQRTTFFEDDSFNGKDRIENFAPEWRSCIDDKYDHHYEP